MSTSRTRVAAAVIALTTLVCVVVVIGDGPLRDEPEPYAPTVTELREVGVITSEFPVPGALPPEIYPPESYGLGPPGPPAWLLWVLGGIVAATLLPTAVRLVRDLRRWRIRLQWPWRWRRAVAPSEPEVVEPAGAEPGRDAAIAREAVAAALAPLAEPTDPRGAVIESYVRMAHVLDERQLGRRADEAPREYLGRVLRERGMPEESLTTLTALFEEARFSTHAIAESAPRRAASELRKAQNALRDR